MSASMAAIVCLLAPAAHAGFDFTPVPVREAPQRPVQTAPDAPYTLNDSVTGALSGGMVSSADIPQIPVTQQRGLVINPYPLQETQGYATHGGDLASSLDQAMMERGGQLRTVALPGANGAGLQARAQRAVTQDRLREASYHAVPDEYETLGAGSLTPFPDGTTGYLALPSIEARPLSPPQQQRQAAPAPMGASGFSEAVGFGRDLPLALALTQVVPPEYQYSFAEGLDPSMQVSWQGGKAWNEVLGDMLAAQGLRAHISGNNVLIQSAT